MENKIRIMTEKTNVVKHITLQIERKHHWNTRLQFILTKQH